MSYSVEKIFKIWDEETDTESYIKVSYDSDGLEGVDITEIFEGEKKGNLFLDKEQARILGNILLELSEDE